MRRINKVLRNSAKCLKCGDVLASLSKYALIECSCGALAISGGLSRLERYGKKGDYVEKSLIEVTGRKVTKNV